MIYNGDTAYHRILKHFDFWEIPWPIFGGQDVRFLVVF